MASEYPKGHHPNSRKNLQMIKPGEIKNPEGRAGRDGEKKKTIKDLLMKKLEEVDVETGLTNAEIIVNQIINQARRGDDTFINMALDRTIGKPAQYIEQHNTGDSLGVIIMPNKNTAAENEIEE